MFTKEWYKNHESFRGMLGKKHSLKTKSKIRIGHLKHGIVYTPTYNSWANMLQRCSNPSNNSYKDYGGRGIKVCERWKNFSNFFADMGERPQGMTLERRNNNKGYYKNNCKWATQMEQNNNSRNCIYITFQGKTMTIAQWERYLGYKNGVIKHRLHLFRYSVEKALTHPLTRGGIPYGTCRFPNRLERVCGLN